MFRAPARLRLVALLIALALLADACSAERASFDSDAGASRHVDDDAADDDASGDDDASEVEDRDVLRLAIGTDWSGDPADADPASVGIRVVAGLLHEGLTALGSDGRPEPGLAERWFVSDDRLQWTFVLPEGLVDGLGLALSARDVKASFERLRERGSSDHAVAQLWMIDGWVPFVAGETGGVSGIVAADETTLVITLAQPYEPLAHLLASPAFGVTGTAPDGQIRTTGDFRMTDDSSWLEAVDDDGPIERVELVRSDGNGAALLASGRVDWAVLADGTGSDDVPGDILRQPLDLRVGVAVRFEDVATRRAVIAALDPAFLASVVPSSTVDVSAAVDPSLDALPGSVTVHVPAGGLEPLGAEVVAQLRAAGVDARAVVMSAADFAMAVADGTALVFPMVSAGGVWAQSAGVAVARAGGVDDVFGVPSAARADLLAAIAAESDTTARAALIGGLETVLLEEGLLLPVATFEVRVGVGPEMDALRVRPDGTLDLDGFDD